MPYSISQRRSPRKTPQSRHRRSLEHLPPLQLHRHHGQYTPECEIFSSSPTCILNPEGETGPYWVKGASGRTCARTSPACPSSLTGNSSTSRHVSQSRTCTGTCGTAIRRRMCSRTAI
ncbi:uncharacterized protein K441DRAFT_324837 [Cenococcum geophilum 1.58]|uniref:Uncharacterized protein n=1 Tax=Cenococcum geophilum 1.58 TaxID=794803 RepID=A0ACC8ER39_9PEZI|nr:hypothetical protein K441DRAFT_324837 [Cenococcum geophilum 1.58]